MAGEKMTFKEELEVILGELLKTIKKLRKISLEKTDHIINSSIEELERLTGEEENLINQMGIIENARIKLLEIWGVGKDTPISQVIEKIQEDTSKIEAISNELTVEFEELGNRNKLNNDLIRENLDWIDFNINLLTSTSGEPSYGEEKGPAKGTSIFDRKV